MILGTQNLINAAQEKPRPYMYLQFLSQYRLIFSTEEFYLEM